MEVDVNPTVISTHMIVATTAQYHSVPYSDE